jgi:hypothetical protein
VPAHTFLLFDHDSKFGTDVIAAVRHLGSQPIRTAFRSLHGRTVSLSAGSGVADETCWIT